ncbi:MAG: hypothetical protein PF482_09265, partial [Desulfobacteraceae bacterium]|nr:hypothetical protein [Desulfobacteraceae bacterium]
GHGGPPYGNTHRRVGHRADRQCVNRPMVNGLCGQNKFTLIWVANVTFIDYSLYSPPESYQSCSLNTEFFNF